MDYTVTMPEGTRYFRARHVATMTSAGVIDDGCLKVVDDRIAAVGRTVDLDPPRVDVEIDGLLTPGLVNAHTHLELTNVPRPPTPGTFQDWLLATMAAAFDPDPVVFARRRTEAVRAGVAQCLRFGVTSVGDVTQSPALTRPVLAASPLRAISYGECLGVGSRRARFDTLLAQAIDTTTVGPRMMIGVSPHAPYTVDGDGYARSDDGRANVFEGYWATHLAETPDEAQFVANRAGPFADLYRRLGFDPGAGEACGDSIVEWVTSKVSYWAGDLLVHVNYCTDADLALIAGRDAVVAWCPRTHAYFGHSPHRWRDMLARGIPVCVATDSCASSPDLNVMDDLRLVRRQSPDVPVETLWAMVTTNANSFLDFPDVAEVGELTWNGWADLCAWPTRTGDPLAEVLDTPGMLPRAVWIGGDPVVAGGSSVAT